MIALQGTINRNITELISNNTSMAVIIKLQQLSLAEKKRLW